MDTACTLSIRHHTQTFNVHPSPFIFIIRPASSTFSNSADLLASIRKRSDLVVIHSILRTNYYFTRLSHYLEIIEHYFCVTSAWHNVSLSHCTRTSASLSCQIPSHLLKWISPLEMIRLSYPHAKGPCDGRQLRDFLGSMATPRLYKSYPWMVRTVHP